MKELFNIPLTTITIVNPSNYASVSEIMDLADRTIDNESLVVGPLIKKDPTGDKPRKKRSNTPADNFEDLYSAFEPLGLLSTVNFFLSNYGYKNLSEYSTKIERTDNHPLTREDLYGMTTAVGTFKNVIDKEIKDSGEDLYSKFYKKLFLILKLSIDEAWRK